MSGIRYDNLRALHVTTLFMILANDHQTCQFTMCAGVGFQGEVSQTSQSTERALQQRADSLCTTGGIGRLQGMQVLELRQGCHFLVEFGVVLHRTGAEWIEAVVHTEVVGTEVRIVAHHGELVTLWQRSRLLALLFLWQFMVSKAVLRQCHTTTALLGKLEYQVSI